MRYILKTASILLATLLLLSCSSDIADYKNKPPKFDIKEYFDGNLIAWGMIQDYSNQVTRRFCVEIDGSWVPSSSGDIGTLKEKFYFDDGEISYRTWTLIKLENGSYTGTAEDVIGIAKGKQSGFAFQWQYQLAVPVDGETYHFDMDDWMYKLDDYRVFNKTSMRKLGVDLAEITLFFDKSAKIDECHSSFVNNQ